MADYAANISVKVKGLDDVQKLEDAVKGLRENLNKVTKAAVNPFQGQITALKTVNKLLQSNAALLKKMSASSVKAATTRAGGSAKTDTRIDEKRQQIHRESLEILQRQTEYISKSAQGSSKWLEITQKLVRAKVELMEGDKANLSLIRTLNRNAQDLLKRTQQQAAAQSKITNEVNETVRARKEETSEAAKLAKQQEQASARARRDREQLEKTQKKARNDRLQKAGSAVNDAFGGAIGSGLKALEGSAIRGAAAGTAILGAQVLTAANNVSIFGKSLDFLQGTMGATVQAIAELTGQWGLAAVAAAAFAPLLPTIGKGIVKGLPAFGQLGKALSDVTGMSERAKPALDSVSRSIDTLMGKREGSFLANGLFGLGPNSLDNLNFPDLDRQLETAKEVFTGRLADSLNTAAIKSYNQALQQLSDRMNQQRAAAETWNRALEDGKDILEAYRRKTLETAKALMELGKARPVSAGFGNVQREIERLDALKRKQQEINQARAEYFGTSSQSRQQGIQAARDAGIKGANVPALRPAGYTDEDVKIANQFAATNKKIQAEIKRTASITDEVKQSWVEMQQFAGKYRYELSRARVEQAVGLKASQTSVLNSKLRLELFKRQNAELQKQSGLYARIAKQIAKNMDEGGPEGFKRGKEKFNENLALGVGFPLLFGGGPGSVAGSAVGSLFGDGFGGQILGGAIGQILDQAVASATKLGNALNDLNMDGLIEQGLVFDAQLQQTISDLKKAGDFAGARDAAGAEVGKQTGDFGGEQLRLAAGSVNELGKAWNGLMNSLKVAVGTLFAPFIQALTSILRLLQMIVVVWNSIADLIGKAGRWIMSIVGVNSDDLYERTRRNTAEYERQNMVLREQLKTIEEIGLKEAAKAAFSKEDTRLNGLVRNPINIDAREKNARIRYARDVLKITEEEFNLEKEEEREIDRLRKEFDGGDQALLNQAIKDTELVYAQMYEQLGYKRTQLEQNFQQTALRLLNERAQEELRQAEAVQQLRRRGMALERGAEDLRLQAEQTIYNLRRQAMAIETAAIELRMSIADRIYAQERSNAELQLEISRRREQLAINERDMLLQASKSFEGIEGEEIFNRIIDGERQLQRLRSEALADEERRKKKLALDIADIDREQKKFELQVAKRIEAIKQQVADYERAAAQAELTLSRAAADLKIAAADYAVEKRKEEIKLMEEAAARLATSMLAQGIGGAYSNTAKPGSSSQVKALVKAANELGVSAKDLAAIISYETIGTFRPDIVGGTGNNYMGLIQFGPEERAMYGASAGQSFEEQVTGPVVRFFKDRFAKVGRSTQGATLSDLYRTVNGGNPNAPLSASDGNGTIADHIRKIALNHGRNAETFLGGNVDIRRAVEEGTTAGIEAAQEDESSTATTQAATPDISSAQQAVDEARAAATAAIGQIPATPSPDTNVDDLLAKSKELAETRKELLLLQNQTASDEASQRIAQQELQNAQQMKQIYTELLAPIRQIQEQQRINVETKTRELELIMNGMLPAQVQQTLEIEKQVNAQLRKIEGAVGLLEAEVAQLEAKEGATAEDEKQVTLLKEKIALLRQAANEIQTRGASAVQSAADANSPQARMTEEVKNAKAKLNELQDPVNLLTQSANTLGDAFGDAFKNIVNGSMSAQEALSTMLQQIANAFIDMAAQMITQYVKLILMQTVLNALGGPSLGNGGGGFGGGMPSMNSGVPLNGMATGGRPKAGEPIIVGERGPEIFTPDSSGSIGSNRYFDAARDSMSHDADIASSNITEQRDSQFYEAMQSPEGREMNVKYDATIINEVEYVTTDQFQRGMKDTATRARAETLKDLRNYPGKRAAVGLR